MAATPAAVAEERLMVVQVDEDGKATWATASTRKGTVQRLSLSLYPGETEVRRLSRRCIALAQIADERARMRAHCCC